MRKYRAEQVAKWLDMRDGWRLIKWQRKILKELLRETYERKFNENKADR